MVDTIAIQVNFYSFENKLFIRQIKSGEITYLKPILYDRGKKIDKLCYKGDVKPYSLYYNASLHYICVEFHAEDILEHYTKKEDCETIMKCVRDFIYNDLKIPKNYIKSFTINRLDFKNDSRVNNQEEKNIAFNLMKKTPEKLQQLVKTSFETAISYLPKHRICSNNYI